MICSAAEKYGIDSNRSAKEMQAVEMPWNSKEKSRVANEENRVAEEERCTDRQWHTKVTQGN